MDTAHSPVNTIQPSHFLRERLLLFFPVKDLAENFPFFPLASVWGGQTSETEARRIMRVRPEKPHEKTSDKFCILHFAVGFWAEIADLSSCISICPPMECTVYCVYYMYTCADGTFCGRIDPICETAIIGLTFRYTVRTKHLTLSLEETNLPQLILGY